MSLYRKYRPKTLQDVVGQGSTVTTLAHAVEQDRLAHAYLFAGPRGTGKTSIARILAKELLTKGMTDQVLIKQIRDAVDEGTIVDLIEIDAASNRGIDDVRELIEKIQFSPVVAVAKVYIIDEVHMLTREAFNALLKTLEEPPPYAHFILATTELQKIPATIQSRCQRFAFRQIETEDMVKRLGWIAEQEKIEIEPEALEAIAHHAQGGLRDAISLLDQLQSLPKITATDVHERVGALGPEHIESILLTVETGDGKKLLENIRTLEEAGMPMETVARQLLSTLRTALHRNIEEQKSIDTLGKQIESLLIAIKDMRVSPVPGLALETALLGMMRKNPESSRRSPDGGIQNPESNDPKPQIQEVQEKVTQKNVENISQTAEKTKNESTPNSQFSILNSSPASLGDLVAKWPDIVRQMTPADVKMSLKNGRIKDISGNQITLSFTSAFHRDRVAQTESSQRLEKLTTLFIGSSVRIHCMLDEEKIAPPADERMVNLVEAAAEIF